MVWRLWVLWAFYSTSTSKRENFHRRERKRVKKFHKSVKEKSLFNIARMMEEVNNLLQEEMDRFIESLLSIREEIAQIEKGEVDRKRNPLKVL